MRQALIHLHPVRKVRGMPLSVSQAGLGQLSEILLDDDAGSGTGTVTKISAFTQVSQIMGFTTSGGDQQFANYSFLEQNFETQIPTIFSAQSISIDIADDPTLAGYIALKAASDARATRALKLAMPDGSFVLYQGYVSFNETPTLNKGQVMQVKCSFSLQSRPVRYAS